MKKIYLAALVLCLSIPLGFSISDVDSTKKGLKIWKENHHVDLSMAVADNVILNSVQWDKLFPIALKKRIKIGFGLRMNVANYWNKDYFTAPPQRVAGVASDTLSMEHQSIYFANLQFIFEVALFKWWDVGMNIDLVGASFGPKSDGKYYSYPTGNLGSVQQVAPETLNLMLFGNNDFGNLNSQFYFRLWPSSNVFIKAGMSLATLTSITDTPLNNGNSRFHAGSYLGFLSLGWTPGRNAWVSCKK